MDAAIDYTRFISESAYEDGGHAERKRAAQRMHVLVADAHALLYGARTTLRAYRLIDDDQMSTVRALAFPPMQAESGAPLSPTQPTKQAKMS
ncbi:hypothetical protein GCM10027093_01750 [Paraburkholderia jirisanensis]